MAECGFVFDRLGPAELSDAYRTSSRIDAAASLCPLANGVLPVTSAAIYARVSSGRQKDEQTIASQTAALRAHAETGR